MANVLMSWTTEAQAIPDAELFTGYLASLAGQEAIKALTDSSHEFLDVAPGTYTGSVALRQDDGTLGPSISGEVVVPEPATVPVPVTISFSVGG